MKKPPADYFIPCEPGRGTLVNGQWYRSKFGKSTLELMLNDDAFIPADELDAVRDDLQSEIDDRDEAIQALRDEVQMLNRHLSSWQKAGREIIRRRKEVRRG